MHYAFSIQHYLKIPLDKKTIIHKRETVRRAMKIKNIVERFEQIGLLHGYLYNKVRILVCVSGGSDSMAMTVLFRQLQQKYSIFLVCGHVNYHLRGEDSNKDEQLVREYCQRQNIPLYIMHGRIEQGESIQSKARQIRLDYFHKLKKAYKLDFIATAHHMADQSETIMHRLLRGAGLSGMSGISPRNSDIIHPVLPFSKDTLRQLLKEKGETFRDDASNFKNDYTRNKIRNELLPHIKEVYNPQFEQHLIDFGQLCYLANDYFTTQANKAYKKCLVDATNDEVTLSIATIRKQPHIVQFYIFRKVWFTLTNTEQDLYSVHFYDLTRLLDTENGCLQLTLPKGITAYKEYDVIAFKKAPTKPETRETSREFPKVRTYITLNEARFNMQRLKLLPAEGIVHNNEQIVIDLDKVKFPITLRYRQNGDRFMPIGMEHFKKLKDFFIDEKVSQRQREQTVIFTDTEKIFWVAGYRVDQRVAVTKETQNYLMMKMENPHDIRKVEREEHKEEVNDGQDDR